MSFKLVNRTRDGVHSLFHGVRTVDYFACSESGEPDWRINGIEVLVAQFSDCPRWYVIPLDSDNDANYELDEGFETVEQAVVYCKLVSTS